MKRLITLLILCLLSLEVLSTDQVRDYLIYNKDTLFFYDSPLEQIDNITGKIEKIRNTQKFSTECWRGFYAEWKLIDSVLYLSKVFSCDNGEIINKTIEKILNRKFENGLLRADWVNGYLWCGNGIASVFQLYFSVYRYEKKLMVEKGKLKDIAFYDFIPCNIANEKSVSEFIIKKLDWATLPPPDESIIWFDLEINIDTTGKVIGTKVIKSNDERYSDYIIEILKELPCWTVYFREGAIYNDKNWITIEIQK